MISHFGYDPHENVPVLRLPFTKDELGAGIEFNTLGADDEMADTMFVMLVDEERFLTKRPEELLVWWMEILADSPRYFLELKDGDYEIELTEKHKKRTQTVVEDLKAGVMRFR